MPRIAVLCLDGSHLSAVATMLDVFAIANRYTDRQYSEREALPAIARSRIVTPNGRPVRLFNGGSVPADEAMSGLEPFDLVFAAPFEIGRRARPRRAHARARAGLRLARAAEGGGRGHGRERIGRPAARGGGPARRMAPTQCPGGWSGPSAAATRRSRSTSRG